MQIFVTKYRFDLTTDGGRHMWDDFIKARKLDGCIITKLSRNADRPRRVMYSAWPVGGQWVTETGELLYDCVQYRSVGDVVRTGYVLSGEGYKPLPPIVPEAAPRRLSRTMQAIEWIFAKSGRTQSAAAKKFDIRQATISAGMSSGRCLIVKCAARMVVDGGATIEAAAKHYRVSYEQVSNEVHRIIPD